MTSAAGTGPLLLHVGIGKTGSSALQVALVRNRERLASAGVRYPEHASDAKALAGGVVSGNGIALRPYLAPRPTTTDEESAESQRLLLSELATDDTVLYSSELLYWYRPARLQELHGIVTRRGRALEAVVYLRDVAGHAVSSYSQMVKRRQFTGTFADYVAPGGSYGLNLRPRLERLVRTLGPSAVTVLHYDSERRNLVPGFLTRVLGVDPTDYDLRHGIVNRSLTRREIALMRHVNTLLRSKVEAHRASDALIARPPLGTGRLTISERELGLLHDRYADEVDWVNETLLGADVLRVDGGVEIHRREPIALEDDPEALALVDPLVAAARR